MKRETLKALGLTDEQIESVMAEHGKTIAAEVAKTTAANTTVSDLQSQLDQRDKDIKELQKQTGGNTDLQKQLDEWQEKYKADTEALEQKLADQKLDTALDAAIHGAKGRNPKAIKALLNREALKLKDDGSIEGLDLDALKTSDAYLFEIETQKDEGQGAAAGGTGSGPGSGNGAISQETFRQNMNNPDWINANWEAVSQGLASGEITKG